MVYQVVISRSAEKELDALPIKLRNRITEKLLSLEENPRPFGIKKLQGQDGYRVRVGEYRISIVIDDTTKVVTIYAIGHRREVYR